MKAIILTFGILSLTLGLIPEPVFEPITKQIRIAKIEHKKCKGSVCELVDQEFY